MGTVSDLQAGGRVMVALVGDHYLLNRNHCSWERGHSGNHNGYTASEAYKRILDCPVMLSLSKVRAQRIKISNLLSYGCRVAPIENSLGFLNFYLRLL